MSQTKHPLCEKLNKWFGDSLAQSLFKPAWMKAAADSSSSHSSFSWNQWSDQMFCPRSTRKTPFGHNSRINVWTVTETNARSLIQSRSFLKPCTESSKLPSRSTDSTGKPSCSFLLHVWSEAARKDQHLFKNFESFSLIQTEEEQASDWRDVQPGCTLV